MSEEQQRLFQAAQDARVALNECIKVFVGLALIGRYPEALMGRGYKFAADARDALIAAVQPFMPPDEDLDVPMFDALPSVDNREI